MIIKITEEEEWQEKSHAEKFQRIMPKKRKKMEGTQERVKMKDQINEKK